MIGDQLDVMVILRSAHSFCRAMEKPDDWRSDFALSETERRTITISVNDCVATFLDVEGSHSHDFGLTVVNVDSVSACLRIQPV